MGFNVGSHARCCSHDCVVYSKTVQLAGMQDIAVMTAWCMVGLHSSESFRQASLVLPDV